MINSYLQNCRCHCMMTYPVVQMSRELQLKHVLKIVMLTKLHIPFFKNP